MLKPDEAIEVRLARLEEQMGAGFKLVKTELTLISTKIDAGKICTNADRFMKIETNQHWMNTIGTGVFLFIMWINQQALVAAFKRWFT